MTPIQFEGVTREIVGDGFKPLPLKDTFVAGMAVMISLWRPSKEELETLNNGGCVLLAIAGVDHPPIALKTEGITENAE